PVGVVGDHLTYSCRPVLFGDEPQRVAIRAADQFALRWKQLRRGLDHARSPGVGPLAPGQLPTMQDDKSALLGEDARVGVIRIVADNLRPEPLLYYVADSRVRAMRVFGRLPHPPGGGVLAG